MKKERLFVAVLSAASLLLASGCATKKFVRNEVTTSETKLNQKIDQESTKLAGQINELSNLNKQLNSRIEQVNDRAAAADSKAEEAKGIGNEAKKMAEGANSAVNELNARFAARNNYQVIDTKSVLFAFNKAELTPESKATLDEIARLVAGNKNIVLTLEGHCDGKGTAKYNYVLSENRVKSVIRYFVGEKKIDLNRLYTLGRPSSFASM